MTLQTNAKSKFSRLHLLGAVLTVCGIALFAYFVYQAGVEDIWNGISRLGFGFLLIIALHGVKIFVRAVGWTMCVEEPHRLKIYDASRAVVIAEALNTMIPLGILISGTSKAVAVSRKIPFVVALSSVAIENLFYSLSTALLIMGGAVAFLLMLAPTGGIAAAGYLLIAALAVLIILGLLMVIRQWRFASTLAVWLTDADRPDAQRTGFFASLIKHPASFVREVRRFEDLLYGFYRRHPNKFLPLFLLQIVFHSIGVFEVWFILQAVSTQEISFNTAFLLESVNRIILIVFKLIPLGLGVDEAGAQLVTESLQLGENVGVILPIIRKGRVLFWAAIGVFLIARSGLSFAHLTAPPEDEPNAEIESAI